MPRRTSFFAFLAGISIALLTVSCGDVKPSSEIKQTVLMCGSEQTALPGQPFGKELRITLLGNVERGFFGVSGKPSPVPGAEVKFVPAEGSDLSVEPETAVSDATGCVQVKVKAGKNTGDNYLRVIPSGYESKGMRVRFVVGAEISGAEQEGRVGSVLSDPLSVKLVKPDGTPATDVPVYFSMVSCPGKTPSGKVVTPFATTDKTGKAETFVQLGQDTGAYNVAVEVADPKSDFFIRSSQVRVMGIDVLAVTLSVIGGLAFFIFGMKLMGDGLQKVAGENMKRILQFFSKNGLIAIIAGTLVTGVIQSSSATTVMVIGFINAGLLTLSQSIGIIFGANIGTTVTAQIISFKLDALALPAVAIGFLVMLASSRVIKGWGETILGFGLLFFGMTMMSEELKMLGTFPSFVNCFRAFDCAPEPGGFMPFGAVLGAILIGMIATFVIQSSSAAMGIVLALGAGGLINFYTAVPLLLGTNIGTTVTAFLASLAANRVAKQAALAHFLFNFIGTAMMVIIFYVPYGTAHTPVFLYFINYITPGDIFAPVPQGIERHIAMAHTMFNVITVALLFPVMKPFARMCEMILPVTDKASAQIQALEPHLLATPSIALDQVVIEIRKMVADSWEMIDKAVNRHFVKSHVDPDEFKALREAESRIDDMQTAVTGYLVQITRRELSQNQSELIPLLMHCTNDAERIADHTENILKLTKKLSKTGITLSDVAREDIDRLWSLLDSQAKNVMLALAGTSHEGVESALDSERKINKLTKKYEKDYTKNYDVNAPYGLVRSEPAKEVGAEMAEGGEDIKTLARKFEKEHVDRRNAGKCSVEASVIFVEMLWELEMIGDHLANIAVRTPSIQKHCIAN